MVENSRKAAKLLSSYLHSKTKTLKYFGMTMSSRLHLICLYIDESDFQKLRQASPSVLLNLAIHITLLTLSAVRAHGMAVNSHIIGDDEG